MSRVRPWFFLSTLIGVSILTLGALFAMTSLTAQPLDAPSVRGSLAKQSDGQPKSSSPIKHVVIIVRENHSFDNLFGTMPGVDGSTTAHVGSKLAPLNNTPDPMSRDLGHGGPSAINAVHGGQMDHFYRIMNATQNGLDVADSQYKQQQIPVYWSYAQRYAIADRFFSTMMAASFPNHLAIIAGTSFNAYDNPLSIGVRFVPGAATQRLLPK